VEVELEADGYAEYVTIHPAEWLAFCNEATGVAVLPDGRTQDAYNPAVDLDRCGDRDIGEIRFGQVQAAVGRVRQGAEPVPVGTGEAWVELLSPADSTTVGDPAFTRDNGTFVLWFPYGVTDPGCDWLVRVSTDAGPAEIRRLEGQYGCYLPQELLFDLVGG
jgi:hypothetical protein